MESSTTKIRFFLAETLSSCLLPTRLRRPSETIFSIESSKSSTSITSSGAPFSISAAELMTFQAYVLMTFHLAYRVFLEVHDACDTRERKRVGFACDLGQQRGQYRQGQWQLQLKARTGAELRSGAHHTAHLLADVVHHVKSDAASRKFSHLFLGAETRQEKKFH